MSPAPRSVTFTRLRVPGLLLLLMVFNAPAATLIDALDNPNLVWRTSTDAPWMAENTDAYDGTDAAQSGVILDDEQTWIETTVTGPAPLSFWWKVSSELGYDQFQFLIDGTEQINISGEVPWQQRTFDITNGTHVLQWRYVKDLNQSAGLDRAWLDQVTYTPPEPFAPVIFENPRSQTVAVGATVTFSVAASGLPLPTYQWFHNSVSLTGETDSVLTLGSVAVADAGNYTVRVTNPLGFTNSAPAILTVTVVGDVVEAPELTWTIGGDAAWFGQSIVTHDGIDALESGTISNQQESWVQARVNGPGVLSFWWQVSSEPFYDGLQFLTNNVVVASLSGEAAWEERSFALPRGTFNLRWRYFKDSSITIGQDEAWLDQVTYVPNKGPTNLLVTLSRQAIAETDSVTVNASFADPDPLDTHTLTVNWRDGSSTTTNLGPGLYSFAATHQYRDDDPTNTSSDTYQITVSVSDEAATLTGIYPLTVSNTPPRLTNVTLTSVIFPYDSAVITGAIFDLSPVDPLRLRVAWGDGSAVESFDYPAGGSSFILRHRYSVPNTNPQITLTATDDDLGVFIVRTNVVVRAFPAKARVLSVAKGTNGNSVVKLQGTAQANYQIQASSDLVRWTTIAIRSAGAGGLFQADDPGGFMYPCRFYRAIWDSQSTGFRLSAISRRTNGAMAIQLIGVPGASYRVDSSTNFINWIPAAFATIDSNGVFNFIDSAVTPRQKFYRAVLP